MQIFRKRLIYHSCFCSEFRCELAAVSRATRCTCLLATTLQKKEVRMELGRQFGLVSAGAWWALHHRSWVWRSRYSLSSQQQQQQNLVAGGWAMPVVRRIKLVISLNQQIAENTIYNVRPSFGLSEAPTWCDLSLPAVQCRWEKLFQCGSEHKDKGSMRGWGLRSWASGLHVSRRQDVSCGDAYPWRWR